MSVAVEQGPRIAALVPWFGGKRSMAPLIVRECCTEVGRAPKAFWELGCGSMAVSLAMPRCSHHCAVDLHGDLINLATIIRDRQSGPVFYRRLRRILNHEALFYEARAALEHADNVAGGNDGLFRVAADTPPPMVPIERAINFFIISWQGRNGTAGTERDNYQPSIRWTSGGGHSAIRFANAVSSIPDWRRRMRDISILCRDLFTVLAKIEDELGTVIYIDPPYIRDGAGRSGSCKYEFEFTPQQHELLLHDVRRFKKARVVLSYYDHAALREWYAGWTIVDHTRQKNLHVQNRRGVGRCAANEILIINGPSRGAA